MFTILSPKPLLLTLLTVATLSFGLTTQTQVAEAAVQNPTPQAKVSFTFDDGGNSNLLKAAPALAQYGYAGTSYVTTSCVGMVMVPNKCAADNGIPYMTWAQIKTLQNAYGWEIGSHSVSHPLMTEISAARLEREVANSKAAFQAQGISATSFATPYGDYNEKVIAAIAKYYTSHRPFHDTGYNTWPYNNYLLRVQQVQAGVTVDQVKSYIDQAKTDNTWLILVFHDIVDSPSSAPASYQFGTADLSAIAAYVKSQNISVSNVSNSLVKGEASDNLVPEPTTGGTIGNGWTTDAPAQVKVDTNSKGNSPEPRTSAKISSSTTKNVHLFTPTIGVNPNSTYVIKAYVNLASVGSGSIGFYIDEYDANGNWISGQYKATIDQAYIKDLSLSYTATSALVAKARLQIIMMAGSGAVVYVDSVQWLEVVAGPAPEPEPEQPNLLSNGTFETLAGWTTDSPSSFSVSTGKINLAANQSGNAHMFSHSVTVDSGASYSIKADLDITASTDEIGFYIDEYDANGNWISGQYICAARGTGFMSLSCNYTPSSGLVASASLQIILPANSSIQATLDNVSWRKA